MCDVPGTDFYRWRVVWGPRTRQPQYPRYSHKTRDASVVLRMLTRAAVSVFSLSLLLTVGVGEAQNWGWGWGAQQKQKQPETYQNRQKYQSNQEFYYDYDEDDYYDGECKYKKVNLKIVLIFLSVPTKKSTCVQYCKTIFYYR